MRVALVTDWLTSFGGAERVLMELHRLFPEAPLYTSVYDPSGLPPEMQGWDVRPSFLQRVPFARSHRQAFLPVMPLAFEQFDLREFDLVISGSSACAKGVITRPDALHLCYCHTPCRYLWDLYHDYTGGSRARALIAPVAHWLRVWDRVSSDRVDHFVANSREVAGRIRKHYRREADIVHPPVDVERIQPNGAPPEDFYLTVSRLVSYKRIDLAVQAATRLGRRLIVVGDGPERARLEALAGPTVELVGYLPDREVAELLARCRAFLFPGHEDFGIAAVEAQAAGRPVVAFGRGGALDSVVDGKTGVLFEEQTVADLAEAMLELERTEIDPDICRANAERFGAARFRDQISAVIERQLEGELRRGTSEPALERRAGRV
ncbi:MAG TPA: glycosyltransferase [Longimicrobiaceae bacterium]